MFLERTGCTAFLKPDSDPALVAAEALTAAMHPLLRSQRTHLWAMWRAVALWLYADRWGGDHRALAETLDDAVKRVGERMDRGEPAPAGFEWVALQAVLEWDAVSP